MVKAFFFLYGADLCALSAHQQFWRGLSVLKGRFCRLRVQFNWRKVSQFSLWLIRERSFFLVVYWVLFYLLKVLVLLGLLRLVADKMLGKK